MLTPLRSVSLGSLTQIGVHLTASLRIDQLERFMVAAGRHPRYLRIERLTVTAPQTQAPAENPRLAVELDIQAFELPRKAAAARSEGRQ